MHLQHCRLLTPVLFLFILTSCKKTNPSPLPPVTGTAQSPNFICQHQPGSSSLNGQFVIFDLDHDSNNDKKYFIVSLIANGTEYTDSCEVIQLPKPIDSLALSWPAQIKSAAFGSTRNILTDAKNAVTYIVSNPWIYAPLLTGTNLYRKLNDPSYAAAKAGQKPFGNNTYSANYYPLAGYTPYNRTYRDITYYFKDAVFTDNTPGGGLQALDTLFVGGNTVSWATIDQTVSVDFERIGSPSRYFRKYFYFDWKNWKYYSVSETEQRKDYLSYAPVYYIRWDVKSYSLDRFCKWPNGWSKK